MGARNFETAVELYRGEFLPDFAVPGGIQFEHWVDLERQRLRDTFIRAAEQLTRQYLSAGHHRDAIALARRARNAAPLSEQGWRLVLEALISASDSLGASLEADTLQQMLADLRGAAAVSPASAAVLVGLNPVLSSSFAASPDRPDGDEALRRRVIAVHELLTAAPEEKPLNLIIDDLHWADRESLRALASIIDRLESEPVLVATAARPSASGLPLTARNSTVLRLTPLLVSDMGALLSSLATLPDLPIAGQLPALLYGASNGIPLLALETLQWLHEPDLLTVENGCWIIRNATELRNALEAGGALGHRIMGLDEAARSVVRAMSIVGVPVSTAFLADALTQPAPKIDPVLQALEIRGMANHVGQAWEPAHDQIAESVLGVMSGAECASMEGQVALAWLHGRHTGVPRADLQRPLGGE